MTSSRLTINTREDLIKAAEHLFELDARFRRLHDVHGLPRLRRRGGGLEGLANIIVGQLVSTRAADVIWGRVAAHLHPFDPARISEMEVDELAALGLTRAKATAIIGAAKAEAAGGFSFDQLALLDDFGARDALLELRGVGPWTADIYLMTCLGRSDAWPAGDLAVRVGLQQFEGMATVPPISEMDQHASKWRPVRAVAARYLWDQYVATRR